MFALTTLENAIRYAKQAEIVERLESGNIRVLK